MSMDVLVPIIVVVKEGSEDIVSPLSDQVILKGSSPLRTRHVNWAISPSLTASDPKENGTISGDSERVKKFCNCKIIFCGQYFLKKSSG